MRETKVKDLLANMAGAMRTCEKENNITWLEKYKERIQWIEEQFLPRGAGFDNGTKFIPQKSDNLILVFHTSFHHMNGNGVYDGWTEHIVKVKSGFSFDEYSISGENKNDIKEYITESFFPAINEVCLRTEGVQHEFGHYFKGEWHKHDFNL